MDELAKSKLFEINASAFRVFVQWVLTLWMQTVFLLLNLWKLLMSKMFWYLDCCIVA